MHAIDVLGIALLASIWGSNFRFVEEALGGLNATQIVVLRLFLATLGLLALFLKKQPSMAEFGAALIGFIGLLVILQPWASVGSAAGQGQLWCLAGATCYAIAYSYASHVMSMVPDNKIALATVQALTATIIMVPLGSVSLTEHSTLTITVILAVVVLGIGTTVAFIVNYWLIARVGPVQASLAFYLIPPVAVACGAVFRDERLSENQALGFVLICLALAFLYSWERLVARQTKQVQKEPQTN